MNSMFEVVICDLDGTLLNNNKEISNRTLKTIQSLNQMKIPVILATARAPRDIEIYLKELALDTPSICYNGALIFDNRKSEILTSNMIDISVVKKLFEVLREEKSIENFLAEKNNEFWVDVIDKDVQCWIDAGCPPHAIGYPSTFLDDHLSKLIVRGNTEFIIRILEKQFKEHLIYTFSDSRKVWLEILCKNAGKAAAVKWIANHYSVPLSKIVAFGDAENDIGMLELVGMGVAMGNSGKDVQLRANCIAPTNENDGVAHTLGGIFSI
ncbi:cof-like hydrolase [Bacillus cereus VD021]|uniref:Cof-like hydrolase n=1 Tax=Bacillus cereus VD021 TaxID=1053224 RepID=R8HDD9_BACCE|nr:Cof-type HAD-IIB family hydrolase [Bacillus cereus]EOO70850.1 cof-like hydrolase [Bacillus cereus VD021]